MISEAQAEKMFRDMYGERTPEEVKMMTDPKSAVARELAILNRRQARMARGRAKRLLLAAAASGASSTLREAG